MRIWKWTLTAAKKQTLELPAGSKLLTVQEQCGEPRLWALCDDQVAKTEPRHIAIYSTGGLMPDDPGSYIGSFQLDRDFPAFHVFEAAAKEQDSRGNGKSGERSDSTSKQPEESEACLQQLIISRRIDLFIRQVDTVIRLVALAQDERKEIAKQFIDAALRLSNCPRQFWELVEECNIPTPGAVTNELAATPETGSGSVPELKRLPASSGDKEESIHSVEIRLLRRIAEASSNMLKGRDWPGFCESYGGQEKLDATHAAAVADYRQYLLDGEG